MDDIKEIPPYRPSIPFFFIWSMIPDTAADMVRFTKNLSRRVPSSVSRITGTALPAGLTAGEGVSPDVTRLQLEAGDCVLLVTDGVAGSASDQWVRDRLAAFDGGSPQELAQTLIDDSGAQVGAADDRTALVLKLARRSG